LTALTFSTLLYSVEEGIATITLNRPERLNAATPEMAHELIAAFDATDGDDSVRAVIVTGAGRGFCAGSDMSRAPDVALSQPSEEAQEPEYRDWGGRVALRIFDSLKPVIAAINGAAVGIGATVPLAMDVRLASTEAKFAFPFARRGIVPESASSWFLPRTVGMATALEWCYSGRIITVNEALARGLITAMYSPEELLPAARAMAREFVDDTAPVSVALTRQMLWRMWCADSPHQAHKVESTALQSRRNSADAKEGVGAFVEKRKAVFNDRVSTDMPKIFLDKGQD